MKFFGVSNPNEFFRRVLRCDGGIHVVEADGTERDLKSMAEYVIKNGLAPQMKGFSEINLRIERPADMDILFSYAMEMSA